MFVNTEIVEQTDVSLNQALSDAVSTIPECIAAGYVDMESGMLLGVKLMQDYPPGDSILDLVAAATADMFQGPTVTTVEEVFNKNPGKQRQWTSLFSGNSGFQREHGSRIYSLEKNPDHVVCFITKKSANIGMVLAKSRLVMDDICDAI